MSSTPACRSLRPEPGLASRPPLRGRDSRTSPKELRLATLQFFLIAAVLAGSTVSCHDARRSNPVDPDLTPPVELTATLDPGAGSVTLSWSRYAGSAAFARYLVLRDADDSRQVDTLHQIDRADVTTFTDSALAPDTGYEYRVSVLTEDGYEATSIARLTSAYTVRAIRDLTATPDSLTGGIALGWRPYADADFESYRVVRTTIGTDRTDTLAVLAERPDTAFVDTSARHRVSYLYGVVTSAAGRLLRSESVVAVVVLPPPPGLQVRLTSAKAAAELTWEAYAGPHFEAYEVWRSAPLLGPVEVALLPSIGDTAVVDGGLLGKTEYTWQVVVRTTRGESIGSAPVTGAFHQLASTLSLSDLRARFLRLIPTDRGVIALAILGGAAAAARSTAGGFAPYSVRLQRNAIEEARLLAWTRSFTSAKALTSATVTGRELYSVTWDGSVAAAGNTVHLMSPGHLSISQVSFADPFDAGPDYSEVSGDIRLLGSAFFDNVVVSSAGVLLFGDNFNHLPPRSPDIAARDQLPVWRVSGQFGYATTNVSTQVHLLTTEASLSHGDSTWQDFRLDVDARVLASTEYAGGVQIGGGTDSRYRLILDGAASEARLHWNFAPPEGSDLPPRSEEVSAPLILGSLYTHLSLGVEEGRVSAEVTSPALWARDLGNLAPWTAMGAVGDVLALTAANQAYALTPDGEQLSSVSLPAAVSELRSWSDSRGRQRLGVCLPEQNQILLGTVPKGSEADWPAFLTRAIGPQIGPGEGILSYPVSFDVGPDGRIFVLDAAASEVFVFDSAGRYLTRFGGRGDGPGQFDLGQGVRNIKGDLDFSGSIAVDGDGFVYVADELNARVQVFAP